MSSLLDVLFILIIFFLVTTTFKNQEDDHRVDLPVDQRNQAMSNKAGDVVKINIRKSGAYVVMDKPVTEEMIETTMKQAVANRPEVKVLIRADKESKHLYLANVLSICIGRLSLPESCLVRMHLTPCAKFTANGRCWFAIQA